MDFELGEERLQAQRMVHDFVEREVMPHIAAWDREQRMDPGAAAAHGGTGPARYLPADALRRPGL